MKSSSAKPLPPYQVRPRFQVATHLSVIQVIEKIKIGLESENAPCMGWAHPSGHSQLMILQAEQHYWSPQLSLTIEPLEEGCLIRGLYGPRESVWTMFVFIYFIIAVAAVILTMIGLSNIYLGKSAVILFVVPVLLGVFGSLYFVAYTGQQLGREQLVTLHDFLEGSLGMETQSKTCKNIL